MTLGACLYVAEHVCQDAVDCYQDVLFRSWFFPALCCVTIWPVADLALFCSSLIKLCPPNCVLHSPDLRMLYSYTLCCISQASSVMTAHPSISRRLLTPFNCVGVRITMNKVTILEPGCQS